MTKCLHHTPSREPNRDGRGHGNTGRKKEKRQPSSPLVLVLLCVNILRVTQTIAVPEKDARLRHHPSILRDPDETPEDPDAPNNGDRNPAEGVVNELESRLFKGRKVMVFGQRRDRSRED